MSAAGLAPSPRLLRDCVQAWKPDAAGVATGDGFLILAVRCFAAAGLWDAEIEARLLQHMGPEPWSSTTAATALARHGAASGATSRQITEWLTYLAVEVPGWPDDPDLIAVIARTAVRETFNE